MVQHQVPAATALRVRAPTTDQRLGLTIPNVTSSQARLSNRSPVSSPWISGLPRPSSVALDPGLRSQDCGLTFHRSISMLVLSAGEWAFRQDLRSDDGKGEEFDTKTNVAILAIMTPKRSNQHAENDCSKTPNFPQCTLLAVNHMHYNILTCLVLFILDK